VKVLVDVNRLSAPVITLSAQVCMGVGVGVGVGCAYGYMCRRMCACVRVPSCVYVYMLRVGGWGCGCVCARVSLHVTSYTANSRCGFRVEHESACEEQVYIHVCVELE
jgi:hypothetical protein